MEEKNKSIVMHKKEEFAGDQKVGASIFYNLEIKFVEKTIRFVPKWLETYHLTMMTLIWSGLIVLFGYLAKNNLKWLWLVSLMIFMQYLTDLFDGKVGKLRKTGLIKWGYYMDHFLDYIFLSSILFVYFFLIPENMKLYDFVIAIIIIGFMVNSYLNFSVTNKFRIARLGIGPTEGRLFLILVNTFIIIFGVKNFLVALPWFVLISSLLLCFVIYRSHKEIWKIDMDRKKSLDDSNRMDV